MTWKCAAIDHAITFYPNGKVGPCCQIAADYLKPKSVINNPDRFADLKTNVPPAACKICIDDEANNLSSYRQQMGNLGPGIAMLDVRNTNRCNLKCRYCGPHYSNKWAEELELSNTLRYSNIPVDVITSDLTSLYFTGGEPMLNPDHWEILNYISKNLDPSKITLHYNTNLTTTKYKNVPVEDIWGQFKEVFIACSIDVAGPQLNYIRSGSEWKTVNNNIQKYKKFKNMYLTLSPVISLLNIWWLDDLYKYANSLKINVTPTILYGPDYLALDVIPDNLQSKALSVLSKLPKSAVIDQMVQLVTNNQNKDLILHTYSHILLLDKMRNENLWDLLPFGDAAKDRVLRNYEYE